MNEKKCADYDTKLDCDKVTCRWPTCFEPCGLPVDGLELKRQIMDSRIPKNEREHWAAKRIADLREFAIWMTGCGYDFCQHEYFIQQRDKLLK